MRARALLTGLLVAGVLASVGAPVRASEVVEPEATRVLLMGDSITHGSAGDWTWRYRLWRHLESVGVAGQLDLVGPVSDLRDGSSAYVEPAFDLDHAARWGNRLAFPAEGLEPGALASTYEPDVVVVLLGLNDLLYLDLSPAHVARLMEDTLAELRAQAPGVDVVLVRIPTTNIDGVAEVNARYSALAGELDTETERVVVADADAGFVPSTQRDVRDTYDPVHPTSRGELRIAAAVADALAGLGIGEPYPRPLARLPLGPRTGASLSARAGDGSARLRWSSAEGTTGEVIWARDLTKDGPWRQRSGVITGERGVLHWLRNGHRYALAVKPAKGWAVATDTRSNIAHVTPHERTISSGRPHRPG